MSLASKAVSLPTKLPYPIRQALNLNKARLLYFLTAVYQYLVLIRSPFSKTALLNQRMRKNGHRNIFMS